MKTTYSFLLLSLLNILLVFAAPTTGLQFNGTSTSYIDCGSKSVFSPTQFTVEAWVNYQTLNDGYIISNEGWGTGAQGFKLHTSGTKFEFSIGANTTWTSVKSNMDVVANTWYHVAVTYTATTLNIYINGLLDNSFTNTGTPMVASTQSLCIGEGSMWKGRGLTGKLADVRFWSVVRSQTEIAGSMSSSLTGTETGLVADWKMNEGTGSTVADATGTHTVTILNTVTWFTPTTLAPIRVVCVGNSITAGAGASDAAHAYPAQLGSLLGSKYMVLNCGVSGRTLLKKGDFPFWNESKYADAKNFDPQIVIIALGTNDSKPYNWVYKSEFYTDYASMINEFRSGGKNPHIFVCLPPPSFSDNFDISNSVIYNQIIPIVDSLCTTMGTSKIDYYHNLLSSGNNFPDGIHPNDAGALIMAKIAYSALTKKIAITSVKSPVSKLSLTANEQITISINNNNASPLVNVPVAFRIDDNTEVKEIVATIPAHSEVDYKFIQKVDLSQLKDYSISVYTAIDTMTVNDSIKVKVTNYTSNVDRAVMFSGSNGKVRIPHTAGLMPLSAFTLEAWIYPTRFRTNIFEGTVISKESNAGGFALNVGGDGQGRIVMGNPNWIEAVIPAKSISLNQWSHIAAVYDGSSLKFYVNGTLKATTVNAGSIASSTSPLYIGASAAFGGRGFAGGIDEVTIWNKALSQAEIASNKDYLHQGNENGLIAYYSLNQTPGTEFTADSTANGNNGTIQNTDLYNSWMIGAGLISKINSAVPQTKSLKGVSIYTNSERDVVFVKLNKEVSDFKLVVTDVLGKTMSTSHLKNVNSEVKIDVRNYKRGLYLFAIICDSEKATLKILL